MQSPFVLLQLLLLLLQVLPALFADRKEVYFNFTGAVIGGVTNGNAYNVKVECSVCKKTVQEILTEADGRFRFRLLLKKGCYSVKMLTVTATSQMPLGEKIRSNRWALDNPNSSAFYAFFMGEFEPKNRLLFLRGLFTSELPNLGEGMAYVLRLTSQDGSIIYGTTETCNDSRTEWSNKDEGIILKLNKDGLEYEQNTAKPIMTLRLYKINASQCSICQYVFRKGVEPAKKLHNCVHYNHRICIKNLLNRGGDNRFKCPVCRTDIAYIKCGENDDQSQDTAEVVTHELDAEGNVHEKHVEFISNTEELEQQMRQYESHQCETSVDQTTHSDGNVAYFQEPNLPLTELFAFNIVQPVLQNGGGERPKFVYEFATNYNALSRPTKLMHGQTIKIDSADDTEDEMLPPAEGSDNDPDLHAVRYIPDVDNPPSPPGSDEIEAGIRAPIETPAERSDTGDQQQPSAEYVEDILRVMEEPNRMQKQQEKIWEQIKRERAAASDQRSSAAASPVRDISNSDTEPELLEALREVHKRASAQQKPFRERGHTTRPPPPAPPASQRRRASEDAGHQLWEALDRRNQHRMFHQNRLNQRRGKIKVDGNTANVEYFADYQLLFFDIEVRKMSQTDSNLNFLPFVEKSVEIKDAELYTFFMGAHFNLSIAETATVSEMPGTRLRLRRIEPLNYVVQVNCHGEKTDGYRSEPSPNNERNFVVFLPGKRCTKFDIYVGKVDDHAQPNKLLARAVESGIEIMSGTMYIFEKAFEEDKNANYQCQQQQQSESTNNTYEEDIEKAKLESIKEHIKRKGKQKMGESEILQAETSKLSHLTMSSPRQMHFEEKGEKEWENLETKSEIEEKEKANQISKIEKLLAQFKKLDLENEGKKERKKSLKSNIKAYDDQLTDSEAIIEENKIKRSLRRKTRHQFQAASSPDSATQQKGINVEKRRSKMKAPQEVNSEDEFKTPVESETDLEIEHNAKINLKNKKNAQNKVYENVNAVKSPKYNYGKVDAEMESDQIEFEEQKEEKIRNVTEILTKMLGSENLQQVVHQAKHSPSGQSPAKKLYEAAVKENKIKRVKEIVANNGEAFSATSSERDKNSSESDKNCSKHLEMLKAMLKKQKKSGKAPK
uniref:RING-type domain-containing protein n=1 Tax=Globodera rostochiensis TaxID=31243 RepID=A0A914I3F8_GLORO